MSKIIFIDIDGPLITGDLYDTDPYCSYTRSMVNMDSLSRLKKLIKQTGARLVTNTMHNEQVVNGRTIRDDLIRWGIGEDCFHEVWRTIFPRIDYTNAGSRRGIGRMIAIDRWLAEQGPHDWVCFDDRNFTDDQRLILVDFNKGIGDVEYNAALSLLGDQG
jgi:hypothetical protein